MAAGEVGRADYHLNVPNAHSEGWKCTLAMVKLERDVKFCGCARKKPDPPRLNPPNAPFFLVLDSGLLVCLVSEKTATFYSGREVASWLRT